MPRKRRSRAAAVNAVPMGLSGTGKVKSFSGAGVTAQFESQKEADEHEDHEQLKKAAKTNPLGIKVFRHRGNSAR